MQMRIPMLMTTGLMAILMVAIGSHSSHPDRHFPSSPAQYGPRPGNECAPSDLNPNEARYTCPGNRSAEQPTSAPTKSTTKSTNN
jgi:hypothetical protein